MDCKVRFCILGTVISLSAFGVSQVGSAHEAASLRVSPPGIVVETIVKGRQAERLGVRAGDIMLRWSRGNKNGFIHSPFDVTYISLEEASRGPVTISGVRGSTGRKWIFNSDSWGFRARPRLNGRDLRVYQHAIELSGAGKSVEAAELLASVAASSEKGDRSWLASWFLFRSAVLFFYADELQRSNAVFLKAIEASKATGPVVQAELFRQWGTVLDYRGKPDQAFDSYSQALLKAKELGSETMLVSNLWLNLGAVDLERNDSDRAKADLGSALTIAKHLAPQSFETATIYDDFGILFHQQGDLDQSEQYYAKALQIEKMYSGESRQLANTLGNLGLLAYQRGDLYGAERYHRRALKIAETIEENQIQLGQILDNLGLCALDEGHLTQAERYQQRALLMRQQAAPESFEVALTLSRLGEIARARGDFVHAEQYYSHAMAIATKAKVPELDVAQILIGQAEVLRERGEFENSEQSLQQALSLVTRINPGSIQHADLLGELAETLRTEGQLSSAANFYRQALAMWESKASHVGGGEEDRSRYRTWYLRYYSGYIDTLLRQGEQKQAFEVLEGSRARTLLEMLSRARINISHGGDPVALARQRQVRRILQAKAEARIRLVTSDHSDEQIARVDREIEDLLVEDSGLEAEHRLKDPEYAALTSPPQLSTEDIQKLLDDETVLLEYSLGNNVSHLWVVTKTDLAVYDLPAKREIEQLARKFYDLLAFRDVPQTGQSAIDAARIRKQLQRISARLSRMILGPAACRLRTKRLLVVSDGALQYIPFAALPLPAQSSQWVPLITQYEITNLPSASVLAEIRREEKNRPKPPGLLAVVADPVFDASDVRVRRPANQKTGTLAGIRPELTRAASDVGLTRNGKMYLDRLLYTRKEAEAIMAFVPAGKGFRAFDFDASRQTVVSGRLANYRIIHFATHGMVNSRHPELSGLVFSLVDQYGERQDGFLKLQDVYSAKLPADLVVLSGCETALGQEISGEGLISLTRGFMYAGASRVIASLWSVSDVASASLMADFYRYMEKEGMTSSAALRRAQLKMLAQERWNSPYFWAAFQIQGEWQ